MITPNGNPPKRLNVDAIPEEMKTENRWVLWKMTHSSKRPKQINGHDAKSNDPATWSSFEDVLSAFNKAPDVYSGIGFMLGDGFAFIDLDNCFDERHDLHPWAANIVENLQSSCYIEISPSGEGLKIFGRVSQTLESLNKRLGETNGAKAQGVEFYCQGRYGCITGKRFGTSPSRLGDLTTAAQALLAKYKGPKNPTAIGATLSEPEDRRSDTLERARRYAEKVEPAISGQGGHGQTLYFCCQVLNGFDLNEQQFRPLLDSYNQRCEPPWTTKELDHKVSEALKKRSEKEPGWMFDNDVEPIQYTVNGKSHTESSRAVTLSRSTNWGDVLPQFLERIKKREPVELWNLGETYKDVEIEKKQLVVVGGPPGAGKTTLLVDWLTEILLHDDSARVLIDQVERDVEQLMLRLTAKYARVNARQLRDGELDENELTRIQCDAITKLDRFATRISNLNPPHVVEDAIQEALRLKASVVCLDYLQRIDTSSGSPSDSRSRINHILTACRNAAMEHGITFLLASSLKREGHKQSSDQYKAEHLSLGSFKESGDIEYAVDQAFIFALSSDHPGRRQLRCVKSRSSDCDWQVEYAFNETLLELSRVEGSCTKRSSNNSFQEFTSGTVFDGVDW